MSDTVSKTFNDYFGTLKDPRINRKKLYPLTEVLFIIIAGSVCFAESWRDYVSFGKEKLDFLQQYYPFENGIPSKNTFARVLAALEPEAFKKQFVLWVQSLQALLKGVIAIDGKTLCNSVDKNSEHSAIHMVSAFSTEMRLVLAQQKVFEKSNEITAIPKLLDLLDLKNQIVTIDAMGTQKAIAKQIIDKGGNYILALKGNQGTLNEDVRLFLEHELLKEKSAAIKDVHEDFDKGHGRIESRRCVVSDKIDWLTQKEQWLGLNTLVMIEETREIKDKKSIERRFFISSLPPDAAKIAAAVRSHWKIENILHWTLDVVFNEDNSRIRKDNAGENMAMIRHITLNMLNHAKAHYKDTGIKALRKKACWGNNNLKFILEQSF